MKRIHTLRSNTAGSSPPPYLPFRRRDGFSAVEIIVGVVLFTAATAGTLIMGQAMRDHAAAAAATNQQNAYSTFQAQVALQGINPSLVANPLAGVVASGPVIAGNSAAAKVRAQFESGSVSLPTAAARSLAGSSRVDAVNYSVASAGNQTGRGAGIGFAIETAGAAPPGGINAIPLSPPTFNITGDLTNAAFPLNNIASLPSSNPAGTVYRYTTDGTAPNGSSPEWQNNPGWTPESFPAQVTLAAFNADPQYAASVATNATYSMRLSVNFARADNRTDLYDFTFADLSSPDSTGIVLTDNVDGYPIYYTLDGSDPATSPTALPYAGPFVPDASLFGPTVVLEAAAVSTDSRILSSATTSYTLDAEQVAMQPPVFVTSNADPLAPGTPVVLSVGGGGSSRTEINGSPGPSSSQATSFPLN